MYRGALEDPFTSNLEPFPWLKLQMSMDVERAERGKEEEASTVWKGLRPSEMIEQREGRGL
jgi:hypothetical protein